MSEENKNSVDNKEIDLGVLIDKVGDFFNSIPIAIIKGILFLKRHSIKFAVLIILGFSLGMFIDANRSNKYKNEIIVAPNMGNTDYLYSKIEFLSSKLGERDLSFFKSIGINNPKLISNITVEPVIDLYAFVNNSTSAANAQNTQNFELIKLLAESGDIDKVIKDKLTSKNYPHHKITIYTSLITSENEIVKPIMKFLNTDEYLNKVLDVSRENIRVKMKENERLITQSDSLIKLMALNLSKNQKSDNLIYNNENNQFNALFELKDKLIKEIGSQKIELIKTNVIIKDVSTVTNVVNTKGIVGNLKYLLPLALIILYLFMMALITFYKKYSNKFTTK